MPDPLLHSVWNTAYGLDISGYSTGGSGFARATRSKTGNLGVEIFTFHHFNVHVEGHETINLFQIGELLALKHIIGQHALVVDTPIDLQGLPCVDAAIYGWELAQRPVDYAFDARPPLADRIGYPVSRLQSLLKSLPRNLRDRLGVSLFETYPAETLRRLGLESKKYKGEAKYRVSVGWTGKLAMKRNKKTKKMENDPETQDLNNRLADTLNALERRMPTDGSISHDEFDAALCAITGVSDPSDLLEEQILEAEIGSKIWNRLSKQDGNLPRTLRVEPPPKGYLILTKRPKELTVTRTGTFKLPSDTGCETTGADLSCANLFT